MASYIQGYDEERFATTVNQNFICLICFNVLREPVLCPRNHHCFCRSCITKHLENFRRCPTCADELTVETLAEPPRMVKDYINELNIHCIYIDRGCQEILQLQRLEHHEPKCGFTPVVCTNQGCGATLNQRDLIHHQSEICKFRKLKCHSCEEMTKTLADMEERMANVEKNMATNIEKMRAVVTMETHMKNMQTSMVTNAANMETRLANVEKNMATNVGAVVTMETHLKNMERNTADMEGKLESVNNEVRGLKTALIEGFEEMEDVLVKMEDITEENTTKVRNTASGDNENIIVAGGTVDGSVEMFNWRQRTWSPLKSMPTERFGATSFVYNNHVTIAGGYCPGRVGDMIGMNINPNPDLSMHWSCCPVELPTKLTYHSSVLYNDHLIVTGGHNANAISDCIHEVQLVPPYTVRTLSRMPEPRHVHSMQLFDDNLLIVGGSPTDRRRDSLNSVVLYDIKKNECKQLEPLPYEVSQMATVRWGDNIVIIGGVDKCANALDTVIIYNVKTEQSHMLLPMRCKRWGCAAVVIGNNIVVLGGVDEYSRYLKSAEAFNFESYTWQELPKMSKGRYFHTAVVV
ncbi:RING finger 151-like [Paramuricea clavata]|uniref:RING finger 151-like n=1 Tax=Paramuricea clavata TaxID=317549 RepID=A0A6S7L1E3_PARCT|nr:RING finger 151-like [Paramuricea clavata]